MSGYMTDADPLFVHIDQEDSTRPYLCEYGNFKVSSLPKRHAMHIL